MSRNIFTLATVMVAVSTVALTFWLFGTKGIIDALQDYSPTALLLALGFLTLNYVAAFLRFLFVIKRLGSDGLGWRPAFLAYNVGQVSSIFLFNIVGQSLGRAAILARHGVGVDASVVGTYVERLVATAVLGLAAVVAAALLFGSLGLTLEGGVDYLLAVAVSLATAALLGWRLVLRGRREWRICTSIVPERSLLWPTVFYTVLAQIAMGAAYWVLLSPHIATISAGQVAAALVIVMFTSSLPISFSGWGIRELSAATALGVLGVVPAAAVAAALTIGTISLVIPLLGAAASAGLVRTPPAAPSPGTKPAAPVPGAAALVLLLACATAVLVLFQVRVPFESHVATVNLADAGALTALGLVGYLLWRERRDKAALATPVLGCLALVSLVMGYALCIGYVRYGTIDWAWINRGIGWLVCLGFAATGAGVVLVAGDRARQRVLAMFLVALLVICASQLALLILDDLELFRPVWFQAHMLQGFALNRNAFAFQLLIGLAVLWLFLLKDIRQPAWRTRWIAAAVLFLACYLTYSRAALVTMAVVIVLGTLWTPAGLRARLWVMAAGLAVALGVVLAPNLLALISGGLGLAPSGAEIGAPTIALSPVVTLTSESSDAERWQTITDGLALWRQYPLFGAGLGGYVQERLLQGEAFQVIHSVPVWLLAETGAVGLVLTLIGVGWTLRWLWQQRHGRHAIHARAAGLVLVVFATFGLVHDVFAQRVFWFVLGLLVAVAPLGSKQATASPASS